MADILPSGRMDAHRVDGCIKNRMLDDQTTEAQRSFHSPGSMRA
jgi:hypothetical protein